MRIGDSIIVEKKGVQDCVTLMRSGDTIYANLTGGGRAGEVQTSDEVDLERHCEALFGDWDIIDMVEPAERWWDGEKWVKYPELGCYTNLSSDN